MFTINETIGSRILRPHSRSFDKEIVMRCRQSHYETLLTWTNEAKAVKFAEHLAQRRLIQAITSTIQVVEIQE